jgi:ferredoxin-NADP reductase
MRFGEGQGVGWVLPHNPQDILFAYSISRSVDDKCNSRISVDKD